jgi:hypothetical protein
VSWWPWHWPIIAQKLSGPYYREPNSVDLNRPSPMYECSTSDPNLRPWDEAYTIYRILSSAAPGSMPLVDSPVDASLVELHISTLANRLDAFLVRGQSFYSHVAHPAFMQAGNKIRPMLAGV